MNGAVMLASAVLAKCEVVGDPKTMKETYSRLDWSEKLRDNMYWYHHKRLRGL